MKPWSAVIVVAAVVLVGGLYLLLHGLGGSASTYEPDARTYHLVLSGGRLAQGATVLEATQGDQITLAVSTDAPSTLHLHGYEKLFQAAPGNETTLSFSAARAGFFPLALHQADGSEANLTALQVQPRP